jgi:hypothetical protein
VGDRVECNCGRWTKGSVVKLFYTQSSFPPNQCAPYQIKLDDGRLIFAPADEDRVIRRATGAAADGPVDGAEAVEEEDEPERPDSEKLCVTVVTGFLGAGKEMGDSFLGFHHLTHPRGDPSYLRQPAARLLASP